MHTQRRYSKRELLGQLRVEYLFSVHELAEHHAVFFEVGSSRRVLSKRAKPGPNA